MCCQDLPVRDDLGPVYAQRCFAAAQPVGNQSDHSNHRENQQDDAVPPPRNQGEPGNDNQSGSHVSPPGISLQHKLQGVAQIPRFQLPVSEILDADHLRTFFTPPGRISASYAATSTSMRSPPSMNKNSPCAP
jgi:hypothetical protein